MGRFFTSMQIRNPDQLDKSKFVSFFTDTMKREGYVPCGVDDSEISYILRFSDNHKWVTLASESYEQGNQLSQTDTGRIAKMLKTACINTVVIDSDCAVMTLYHESGKKADTLILGRADDYFGDTIPHPSEKLWSPFLEDDHTWEQLLNIQQGDYIFVEEGLSQLAQAIGISASRITFSAEDVRADDNDIVILDFKKARPAIVMSGKEIKSSMPAKALTLNAAFKQIVGEALAPYGFQVIKGRHPYIVRLIHHEILHIITFCPEIPEYPEDKAIAIMGGVATIYRQKIALNVSPKDNRSWLTYMQRFYVLLTKDTDIGNAQKLYKTCYDSQKPESLTKALKEAAKNIQAYMLPVLDKVQDIDACLAYCQEFLMPCNPKKCTKICSYYPDEDEAFLYFLAKEAQEEQPAFLNNYLQDPAFRKWVMDEIEKRKADNLKILDALGLISS